MTVSATSSAVVQQPRATLDHSVESTSQSPITKALHQQKIDPELHHTKDEIKVLVAIKSAPTQNFFAVQNQKFTRFLQSFFQNS